MHEGKLDFDDLKNIIDLLDFDNISINVFLPKENQKEQ